MFFRKKHQKERELKSRKRKFHKFVVNTLYTIVVVKEQRDTFKVNQFVKIQRMHLETQMQGVDFPISRENYMDLQKIIWYLGGTLISYDMPGVRLRDFEIMWDDLDHARI
jgi:hypothetical protein